MKKLFILLNLFIVINCMSQTYEELQDIFYFTSKKLDAARDSLNALKNLDSVINIQKKQLAKDSVILKNDSVLYANYEKKVSILSEELYKRDVKPVFEFKGFFAGLSSSYLLDSNIIKNTIWNSLKYDLTGSLKFTFFDKIDLSCAIGIPVRKENIFLKTNIEWRIFK
jgi:hypothetical protein